MKTFLKIMFVLFLSGCMPLKQIEWHTSNKEIRISPEKLNIHVCVLTQNSEPSLKPTIDEQKSYAISPSGIKYKLHIQKNDFASRQTSTWTADYLYLIDSIKSGDSIKYHNWENGEWELYLAFDGPSSREPILSKFKLWTYWYSPFRDGRPV